MDIVFLSKIIPYEVEAEIRSKISNSMEDAATTWQRHIVEGLDAHNGRPVKMINFLPIYNTKYYKDKIIHKFNFSHVKGSNDINLPFLNIKFIKRILQWISLYYELKKWGRNQTSEKKVLIAYTLYPEYMRAMKMIKKEFNNIATLAIVVDLPEFTVLANHRKKLLFSLYEKWSIKQAYENIKYVDGLVVITDQMADKISKGRPYCVVEGIYSHEFPYFKVEDDRQIKRIIYAGMLHEKFGITKLLDSFSKISNPKYRLIICGRGEAESEILRASKRDERIEFLGQLPREQVLKHIITSTVIINPRENKEKFTKYSFPSKNIEALSSGRPFIGYKLDGIPDEYNQYINFPENESAEALAAIIELVCEDVDGRYEDKAKRAQEWVMDNKNCVAQGKKIIDLIQRIGEAQEQKITDRFPNIK